MTVDPRPHVALALALCLGAALVASPASALDCGTRLVTAGDSEAYVRSVCGEPAGISTRTESQTQFVASPYGSRGQAVIGSAVTITTQIDVWVYDFGNTRFMEEMTFANGVLRSSRALGYGTAAGNRRRRESLDRHGSLPASPALPTRRALLVSA